VLTGASAPRFQGVEQMNGVERNRYAEWGIGLLRAVVGLVFVMHGWQKVFQFGVAGIEAGFTQTGIPLPGISAPLVSFTELIGGSLLLVGLFTRWVALPLAFTMVVAFFMVHLEHGFFLPQGFEFVMVLFTALVALVLAGPGAAALDNLIRRRRTDVPS
ncbi:MAG TPA: DoxX family protein, partial [Longimicrobiaceae bacterium]|nr:DoxX family protein [Longimicrobiaceae bacterium]